MKAPRVLGAGCAALCVLVPALQAWEAQADTATAEPAAVLITEKGVLDEALLYVVDRKSADAAAAEVAKLLKANAAMPRRVMLSEYDRSYLAVCSCFGSTRLMSALGDLYEPDSRYQEQLAPYLTLQAELGQLLQDMADVLEKVTDKAGADAAAEMAQNIPAYMESLREKVEALPLHDDDDFLRVRVRRYHVTVRPGASRVLQAWGKLVARDENMYGSTRLAEALPLLNEALENLGMAADPGVLPELVQAAEQMQPLLEEWLAVCKGIRDKAGADAAAPRLHKLAEDIRAVSIGRMGSGYEKDLSHVSPRLQMLMMATDRVSHWFAELPTPYYGSEALRAAMAHEE